jgi:Tol biopolymer transport system component
VPLTADAGESVVVSWSREGRWIYFASNRIGRHQVWKVAASGGPAVEVTRGGGFVPFESNDGKFVYYMRDINIQGIWRVPVGGGEEEPVVDGPPRRDWWGYWAVLADGIYFASQDGDARGLVKYFEFATKQTTTLGHLEAPSLGGPFFEVSPDGRWLFYAKNKGTTSDIVLVNNFR